MDLIDSTDRLATFVDVIVPLHVPLTYTYRVMREQEADLGIGKRVAVQFGAKKVYAAIIHHIHHQPPPKYEAKYILEVLDETPTTDERGLKFWKWIADYYMCNIGDVMQAALPASLKMQSQTSVVLNDTSLLEETELSDKEHLIVDVLLKRGSLLVDEVAELVQLKNVFSLLKSLYTKGIIVMQEQVDERYKPKLITCIGLNETYTENEGAMQQIFAQLEKKEPQLNLLLAFLHLKNEHVNIDKKLLLQKSGASESTLQTLIKKQIFFTYNLQVDRLQYSPSTKAESFELNEWQQSAFEQIKHQCTQKDVVLLHGITSSGKTHVYVKLIEEQLSTGKQVLFLVPEIALTSQMIARVSKYFGDECMSYNSRYSANERAEIWQKVKNGHLKVLIGARSALFLPYMQLGLIIVDEEHETSYKQHDPAPRYHARDAAIVLAQLHQCKIILGSATPAFETYYNASTGKYGLVKLEQRHGNVKLPEIVTANIAEDKRTKKMSGSFTEMLMQEMESALKKGEQVILFQNRRGFAPIYECEDCHHVVKCTNCDISLTYHKYNDSLKCHCCGYTIPRMVSCEACGSQKVELKGLGTEKIEDELSVFFPETRILRLDWESTRSKSGHAEIIHRFQSHEADILVGTQMLSKGLDFPGVSLVGVINADQLLHFPDFRAHERAYQLLTQVSGRAGRSKKQGKVIIQTNMPNHRVIQSVINQQYEALYTDSINERKEFAYPPYTRLITIRLKDKDSNVVHRCAQLLYERLHQKLKSELIGPQSPVVSRIKSYYIREILLKIDKKAMNINQVKQFIDQCITYTLDQREFKRCIIQADVDPI
jgi:primosomal protein N' (replication factor Y)